MSSIIYTDSKDPHGKTIRYNVDMTTGEVAQRITEHYEGAAFLEIPDHDSNESIFVNPDHIVSIKSKEDS